MLKGADGGALKSGSAKGGASAGSAKSKRGISWKDQPTYAHTGVVEAAFPLNHENGKSTQNLFEHLLEHTVSFTRKHAMKGKTNLTILPYDINDTKTTHIRSRADFHDHQMECEDYFDFENPLAFLPMNRFNNRKTIHFSMRLGADFDIKKILSKVAHWLQIDKRIILKWKGVQLMSTMTEMTMAGVSDLICPNEFKSVSDIVVERSEMEMYGDAYANMGKLDYDVQSKRHAFHCVSRRSSLGS